jgi:hypothetical protein
LLNPDPPLHLGELDSDFSTNEEVIFIAERLKKKAINLHFLSWMSFEKELYKWYDDNWGPKGLSKGYICVVLDKEEAARAMFLNSVWMIINALTYVQLWYKSFNPEFASHHKYPLWLKFTHIHEHFQAQIDKIVKPFGQLLVGDKHGSRTLCPNAHVCVKRDISRQCHLEICLPYNGFLHIQKVFYLNLPNCCFVFLSPAQFIKECPLHKQGTFSPLQNPAEKQKTLKLPQNKLRLSRLVGQNKKKHAKQVLKQSASLEKLDPWLFQRFGLSGESRIKML